VDQDERTGLDLITPMDFVVLAYDVTAISSLPTSRVPFHIDRAAMRRRGSKFRAIVAVPLDADSGALRIQQMRRGV
jgi:hypothetical protein